MAALAVNLSSVSRRMYTRTASDFQFPCAFMCRAEFANELASTVRARREARDARREALEQRIAPAMLRASLHLGPVEGAAGRLTATDLEDMLQHTYGEIAASESAAATLASSSFGFTLASAGPSGLTAAATSTAAGPVR
jgi:hypothetical protein